MICPICKTKNNYYVKRCVKCGCILDEKQIEHEIENQIDNEKPVFLYQTKEEKEIKQKLNKKGIILLSVVMLTFITVLIVGWTNESKNNTNEFVIEDEIQISQGKEKKTNDKDNQTLNKQATAIEDKKKQN